MLTRSFLIGNKLFNQQSRTSLTMVMSNWLTGIWNRVDKDRIKLVGPDMACAEWLLRNGSYLRWKGISMRHTDYNTLPAADYKGLKIEEILANNASISVQGFPYLHDLTELKTIRLNECRFISDNALDYISTLLKHQLEILELRNCYLITDTGVKFLQNMSNLRQLTLLDLPAVEDIEEVIKYLTEKLPKCSINNGL